jgi:hypothetical protein
MGRVISIALAVSCTSCVPLSVGKQYFGQATPLCNVVQNEQNYAGQRVLVRGLLVPAPHRREIYDPECKGWAILNGSSDRWEKRARRAVEGALANDERARIPVVVSGVFEPWTRYENGQPIIQVGGPSIEDARIVAVRQP